MYTTASLIPLNKTGFRYAFLLLTLFVGTSTAAQVYFSRNGRVTVSGSYRGAAVVATSHQLHVRIHYNTSEIHLHLPIASLKTNNDSLRSLLVRWADKDVLFTGSMPSGHLHTRPHAKRTVPIQGTLSMNGYAKPYSLNATLEHLSEGSIRCMLSGNGTIRLSEFGIKTAPDANLVQLNFQQLVLSSPREQ